LALFALLIVCCGSISKTLLAADEERLRLFQDSLDAVRRQYRIPGLSAAIVKNQQIIWEKGYGYADIANGVAAQPDTPYLIASLTKTFTSMLLMHCVEQGSLNLDDPIRKYTAAIPEPGVTVRHVFTHTSESKPPGESYHYNGNRFGALGAVVDSCQGTPFRLALAKSILDRLDLLDTMPGKDTGNPSPSLAANFSPEALARYSRTLQRLAKPYVIDNRGQAVLSNYPQNDVNAAAGIISTVRDLARYDEAIDQHLLLQPGTQEAAWTNPINSRGQVLPYALGWFVQRYAGQRVIWHYGYWDTFSALILKIPDRQLTLLLLANSDGLSAPFSNALGGVGDVTGSAFAMLFLRLVQESGVLAADSPAISSNGVVNAASFVPIVSPGSWATIIGQNLAAVAPPGRSWRAEEIVDGALPTSLEGVAVQVDGKPAAISFVGPGQINIQIPDAVSVGRVSIRVAGPTGLSESEAVVQSVAPALFTTRIGNQDVLVALHADGTLVGRPDQMPGATPARAAEVISLYGTGFGVTDPPRAAGKLIEPARLPSFIARIGDIAATSDFGGLVAPGLYQFNIRVPLNLSGDQAVFIETAGITTQTGMTIAVR
jgi:uncharacterized protein (TIGR03437 family)